MKNTFYKYTVPKTGYYKIETYGGQGGKAMCGGAACNINAKGASASGYIQLNKDEVLYVYAGGAGEDARVGVNVLGGYNGGGNATWDGSGGESAGGGGGATDIRYFGNHIPTHAELVWNSELGLNSRIMVAAGAGGSSWTTAPGVGGALSTSTTTQTSGYAFGIGGNGSGAGDGNGVAGGGGGYYGGQISPSPFDGANNSGIGGSSFISGYTGCNAITSATDRTPSGQPNHYSGKVFTNATMTAGSSSGNGKAVITYTGTTAP